MSTTNSSPTTGSPASFTTLGSFAEQVDALPDDIGKIAHAVQMLLVHRWWAPAYDVEVTPERETENGLHGTEAMLAKAMEKSPRADRRACGCPTSASSASAATSRR